MARHPTLLTPCLNADGPAPAASSSAPVLGAGQGTSSAFVSPRYRTLATPPIPEPIPALRYNADVTLNWEPSDLV